MRALAPAILLAASAVVAPARLVRADTAAPGERAKALVTVRADRLELAEPISFETAKAAIKALSFPLLDAVAAAMKEHPKIALVEIQGHSDERGVDAYNLKMTEARAAAVKAYLVEHGVPEARLRARGYGETKPLCSEHNEACWSKNRRIDFVILSTP